MLSLSSFIGVDGVNTTLNSTRMSIHLKPTEQRGASATEVIRRVLPEVPAPAVAAFNARSCLSAGGTEVAPTALVVEVDAAGYASCGVASQLVLAHTDSKKEW